MFFWTSFLHGTYLSPSQSVSCAAWSRHRFLFFEFADFDIFMDLTVINGASSTRILEMIEMFGDCLRLVFVFESDRHLVYIGWNVKRLALEWDIHHFLARVDHGVVSRRCFSMERFLTATLRTDNDRVGRSLVGILVRFRRNWIHLHLLDLTSITYGRVFASLG